MTGTITEDELAGALARRDGSSREDACLLSRTLIADVVAHREPVPGPLVMPADRITGEAVRAVQAADNRWAAHVRLTTWESLSDARALNLLQAAVGAALGPHLPVILDGLRIAVASGGYECERKRYAGVLAMLSGKEDR